METAVHELWPVEVPAPGTSVTLTDFDPAGEDKVLVAMCYPYLNLSEEEIARRVAALGPGRATPDLRGLRRRAAQIAATAPGGPSSALLTDSTSWRTTGRSGTCSATACSPSSGSRSVPISASRCPALVEAAGLSDRFLESLERSKSLHDALAPYFPEQSALRGGSRFQHPFRAADERPRGDARPRAALGSARTSGLPQDRPRDAPAHRRAGGASRHRRGHELRRPQQRPTSAASRPSSGRRPSGKASGPSL